MYVYQNGNHHAVSLCDGQIFLLCFILLMIYYGTTYFRSNCWLLLLKYYCSHDCFYRAPTQDSTAFFKLFKMTLSLISFTIVLSSILHRRARTRTVLSIVLSMSISIPPSFRALPTMIVGDAFFVAPPSHFLILSLF